jgi:hypothetical protein
MIQPISIETCLDTIYNMTLPILQNSNIFQQMSIPLARKYRYSRYIKLEKYTIENN